MRRSLLALLLAGCVTEVDEPRSGPTPVSCDALEGRRFESLEEFQCGPGGGPLCRLSLEFLAIEFDVAGTRVIEDHGDYSTSERVQCAGTDIVYRDGTVFGTYDPDEDRITWGDVVYVP